MTAIAMKKSQVMILAVLALAGCAYTPPLGYTDEHVNTCKAELAARRLGYGILGIFTMGISLGSGPTPAAEVLNECLAEMKPAN